jgi:phosphorylase/glycogen(starch) synthase
VAIKADNCSMAKEIADWKEKLGKHWDGIIVKSVKVPDSTNRALRFGEVFKVEVILDCGELKPDNIGLEVVFGEQNDSRMEEIAFVKALVLKDVEKGLATFVGEFEIDRAGVLDYAIRVFPVSGLLSNKQETRLIRYI